MQAAQASHQEIPQRLGMGEEPTALKCPSVCLVLLNSALPEVIFLINFSNLELFYLSQLYSQSLESE